MSVNLNQRARILFPRFSVIPPLTFPLVTMVTILSALSAGLTIDALQQQQQLVAAEGKLATEVQQHQRAALDIYARTQHKLQSSARATALLSRMTPIGRALSTDVAITQLDASMENESIRIEVKANSLAAVLDFSSRLEQSQASVELQNHRPEKESHSRWPVGATLVVKFNRAAIS